MDTRELLDQGFAWTAARIAAVPATSLDIPTPCGLWNLQELLGHVVGTATMITDAVAGVPTSETPPAPDVRTLGSTPWDRAIAELAARSRLAWAAPGVMDRTFELPFATLPAAALVSGGLLELVTHGWDISQSTGEAAEIPDTLARHALDFARRSPVVLANRGDAFAAELGSDGTPCEQLVAFLGRKPL